MPDAPTPTVSAEQSVVLPDGIELTFQTFGDPTDRPLLLVMGLGGPMTWWPAELCSRLASERFFVVRYDNRDTGRSSRVDQHRVTTRTLVQAFLGRRVEVPYSLRHLAADAFGLLDHLGIERAHVAGVSMGGMIAQTMAIEHPERVASLTSIMSSTGRRTVGFQDPKLLPHLLKRAGRTEEEYVAGSVDFWRRISSPLYRTTDEAAAERARETWTRGVSLSGVMRQMVAILTQRDRTEALAALTVPAVVVHGLADRMVHVSGGRATARAIPGAELVLVHGMGHDLPPGLFDTYVEAISRAAARAR